MARAKGGRPSNLFFKGRELRVAIDVFGRNDALHGSRSIVFGGDIARFRGRDRSFFWGAPQAIDGAPQAKIFLT